MADTTTTNLSLTKPEVGASTDTWGTKINNDLDALDAIFSATGTAVNVKFSSANFDDNAKAIFGTGDDLQIFHDGSDSYVNSNGADLRLKADDVKIYNYAGTEVKAIFTTDGSVDLYHNNVKKFETSAAGATVTGTLVSDAIGIGNASPTTNLHIGSGTAGNALGVLLNRGATTNFFEANDGTKSAYIGTDSSQDFIKLGSLSNHAVQISQNNAAAITIDTSKNVGIGTTIINSTLSVGSTDAGATITSGGTNTHLQLKAMGSAGVLIFGAGGVSNGTAGTERMRIDASGNMFIGTTTANTGGGAARLTMNIPSSVTAAVVWNHGSHDDYGVLYADSGGTGCFGKTGLDGAAVTTGAYNNTSGSGKDIQFYVNGALKGQVTSSGVASVSDEKFKEDIEDISYGLDTIKTLQPRKFKWKDSGENSIGFIAQEVKPIISEVIYETENGAGDSEVGMSMNYSALTAVLTKAIQEQQTQIEALQAEINTLKGE